jgi:hypothetical protein
VDPLKLEVRVEGAPGSIPVRAFLDALRGSLDVLDQLERAEHPDTRGPGRWLIADLSTSSANAVLRRADAPDLQTPLRLVEGVAALREQQVLPPYFSSATVAALVRVGEQTHRPGVSGVTLALLDSSPQPLRSEELSEAVLSNARKAMEGSERTLGSVTGLLDVINLRRGARQVSLYDQESKRAVRCRFSDDLFETLRESLGHRVRALGTVTRNRTGQILRLDINTVERLPESVDVPSVDDLAGIAPWYTGEQSTDDFLRSVRGA